VGPLIERCKDPDRATRKFACFAIGNAGGCPRLLMYTVANTGRTMKHVASCCAFIRHLLLSHAVMCARCPRRLLYTTLRDVDPVGAGWRLQASTMPPCMRPCARPSLPWWPCSGGTKRTRPGPMQQVGRGGCSGNSESNRGRCSTSVGLQWASASLLGGACCVHTLLSVADFTPDPMARRVSSCCSDT
jgi:hypothetical protein